MKTLTYLALAIALWILPFEKLHAQFTGQLTALQVRCLGNMYGTHGQSMFRKPRMTL